MLVVVKNQTFIIEKFRKLGPRKKSRASCQEPEREREREREREI